MASRDPAPCRVAGIEGCIERLAFWRVDILIKTEPVHICSTAGPAYSVEHQFCAVAVDIGVSRSPRFQRDPGVFNG